MVTGLLIVILSWSGLAFGGAGEFAPTCTATMFIHRLSETTPIETPRLRLVTATAEVANQIAEIAGQPENIAMSGDSGYVWRESDLLKNMAGDGTWSLTLAILERGSNQVMGGIHFRGDKKTHQAWLVYTLAQSAWGKGFMSEALPFALHAVVRTERVRSVQTGALVTNKASQKILVRSGFKKVYVTPRALGYTYRAPFQLPNLREILDYTVGDF